MKTTCYDAGKFVLKKTDGYLWFILFLVLNSSLVFNAMAFAKEGDTSEKNKSADYQLENMIVTAQKQEEKVQEVPVSMTVMDSMAIEDAKIESILNLGDFIPNFSMLEISNSNINTPSTRGIYATMESGTVSTSLVVDGVPILSPIGYETSFVDVERVEFLRGPQGTLYGKGAEAGVMNIVTRQPDNDFKGKISVGGGKWLSSEAGDWLANASVYLSGPIVKDKLFFGVSGRYETKDGFILNTTLDDPQYERTNQFGKVKLRWGLTDKLEMSLMVSRFENSDDSHKIGLSTYGVSMYNYYYGLTLSELPSRIVEIDLADEFYDITEDQQALKVDYDLTQNFRLTSITTNWRTQSDVLQDFDITPYTLSHVRGMQDYKRTSEELRLSYAKDRFKWLLGTYLDTDDSDTERITTSIYSNAHTHRIKSGDSYALFGSLTYPLTQRMSLTGGLRYEAADREFEDRLEGISREASWEDFSPKVALEYAFTQGVMAYVSAAKGYRAGGFNELAESEEYYSYDPETLWSYEMGMKTALFDNKLILNGALFYMDIDDMHATETILSGTGTGMSLLLNATEATSKGFELEATYRPAKGLTFMAGFGYTNVEFGSFSDILGDYTGNKAPWSPEYTFNLGGQYRHSSGWYVRVDLIGYGKMYFSKTNEYAIDPYEVVNAKIGYEHEHFDVYLYGKNIFDKNHDYAGSLYDGYCTMFNEPGEIGLQLTYRF